MAHAVKCLFCNHEDRRLIPRTHLKKKNLGMVACTWNLSVKGMETANPKGLLVSNP